MTSGHITSHQLYGGTWCQCCGKKIAEGHAYCLACALSGGQRVVEHKAGCGCPRCRTESK